MRNLLDNNGFVTQDDLFKRMVYNRPNNGFFILKKVSETFSELRTPTKRLFEIYTRTLLVEVFVKETIESAAKSLSCAVRFE